jgi:transcriptional regulator with XRE-family HTH domain
VFLGARIFMKKHLSRQHPAVNPAPDRLWAHLGARIRLRREQIGMTGWTAANGVGVELQTYRDFEQGERLIPADQLAALAQLLNVPVFFFFEDLQNANLGSDIAKGSEGEVSYAVATQTDRIAILVGDFQKLDFVRQQCLLLVARALADDKKNKEAQSV